MDNRSIQKQIEDHEEILESLRSSLTYSAPEDLDKINYLLRVVQTHEDQIRELKQKLESEGET
jgi:flagellar hook-associated protein FlgK